MPLSLIKFYKRNYDNIMRKLASIQRVLNIEEIEGADAIVKATIEGWNCVVKKGEFKINDLGVFFEIDSLLPPRPWCEFMAQYKYRVKTIKLRGVVSQGLFLPLSAFSKDEIEAIGNIEEDKDITEILGVKKYEIPEEVHIRGIIKGTFPSHLISKTDEIRIQSAFNRDKSLNVVDEIRGLDYYITTKCDGTSSTFLFENDMFFACSRNNKMACDKTNVYGLVAHKYDLPTKLENYKNLIVQGEICGPAIQKNKLGLSDVQLFVFNIYDVDQKRYLNFQDFVNTAKLLNLQTVPVIEIGNNFNYSVEDLIEYANNTKYNNNSDAEGIVVRPQIEAYSNILHGRLSFKIISNNYLLKAK